jgi:hypothetical protein
MYPAIKQSQRRITIRLRCQRLGILSDHPNRGVPESVFSEISQRFPQYVVSTSRIELKLPKEHPDLDAFINFAKGLSLHIEPDLSKQSQVEILDYTKCSDSEVSMAKYLEGEMIKPIFRSGIRIDDGICIADPKKFGKGKRFEYGTYQNLPHLIFVRGSAKSRLESSNLKGLELLPIPTEKGMTWTGEVGQLFLLWSSVEMPHCDLKVFDAQGNVLECCDINWGENNKRWYPVDGYEVRPLLKYRRAIHDVDVALSKERFYDTGECYRRIIYSQKARAAFERIGMILDWVPVRVANENR